MMRIFGDILNAGSNILRVFNLNQVVGSEQQNSTAAVGRIVRNTDFCTVGNGVAGFQFFRIDVNREQSGVEALASLKEGSFFIVCLQEGSWLEGS